MLGVGKLIFFQANPENPEAIKRVRSNQQQRGFFGAFLHFQGDVTNTTQTASPPGKQRHWRLSVAWGLKIVEATLSESFLRAKCAQHPLEVQQPFFERSGTPVVDHGWRGSHTLPCGGYLDSHGR
jgi:hypothetical protein